jgi:hypothetical protein
MRENGDNLVMAPVQDSPNAQQIEYWNATAGKRRETIKRKTINRDAACISRQSQPEPSNQMSQMLS